MKYVVKIRRVNTDLANDHPEEANTCCDQVDAMRTVVPSIVGE